MSWTDSFIMLSLLLLGWIIGYLDGKRVSKMCEKEKKRMDIEEYLKNPSKVLKSAMVCKEREDCNNCSIGEDDDFCFETIMDNTSTLDKAEMLIQVYKMGAKEAK